MEIGKALSEMVRPTILVVGLGVVALGCENPMNRCGMDNHMAVVSNPNRPDAGPKCPPESDQPTFVITTPGP